MTATTQISTKLSVGSMGLNKEKLQALLADKEEGATVVVANIFGRVSKYEEKPSKLDPTKMDVAFRGSFEGHNLITGEIFNAPKAYLPGAAEGTTKAACDTLGEGEAVEFGVQIAVKKDKTSAVGYVFGVAVPKQPEAQDSLSGLRSQMAALTTPGAAQIAAPKKAKNAE